jgi:DNA polymerase type B, organellar and viral
MSKENIPNIKGSVYSDIKKSYYGGFVDCYIPFAKDVKCYDVNSLYPSSMAKCPMPVGSPVYTEGSSLYINSFFGFMYVKVYVPNIHTPILPGIDIKIERGLYQLYTQQVPERADILVKS